MKFKMIFIGFFASIFLASSVYADVVSFTPSATSTVPQGTNLYWDMQSGETSITSFGAIGDFQLSDHGDIHFDGLAAMVINIGNQGGEKLPFGTSIDAGSNWSSTGNYIGTTDYDGTMIPPETTYFGLRFELSGQIHYGWVQIEEGLTDQSVLAWGYETTPDLAIAAGDQGSLALEETVPTFSMWALIVLVALFASMGMVQVQRKRRNKTI